MKTVAFIDAGQFRPAIVNQRLQMGAGKRFDWNRFRQLMDDIAGGPVFDVHYFDCVSDAPSAGREAFHQFLRNTLAFQLHFTELKEKRRTCNVCRNVYVEHEQKGVDVGIAVQMLKLAFNGGYEQALLCSGDGDFSNLVLDLRDTLGKRVTVVGWHNGVAPSLRDAAYRVVHLEEHYNKVVGDLPETPAPLPAGALNGATAVPALNGTPGVSCAAPCTNGQHATGTLTAPTSAAAGPALSLNGAASANGTSSANGASSANGSSATATAVLESKPAAAH
ncbi:MAG TPA: NYN domain-containing protein [Pirellulales bacterium]